MTQTIQNNIEQASSLLKAGQKGQARSLLVGVVKADAQNVQAWYLLSFVADDTDQALYCIRQAAKFAPQNAQVQQRLSALEGGPAAIPGYQKPAASAPRPTAAPESVPFYREPLFKGFAFLMLTPIWVLIMLTDKKETATMKMIAVGVQIVYCLLAFWIVLQGYLNLTS